MPRRTQTLNGRFFKILRAPTGKFGPRYFVVFVGVFLVHNVADHLGLLFRRDAIELALLFKLAVHKLGYFDACQKAILI